MNKKIIVLMLISVFLVSVFAVSVNAGVVDMLKENELLKWIFYDLAKDLISDSPTTTAVLMARFLVAILVISLMSGVTSMVLGSMPKGAQIGASTAIGLIAAAAIPEKMLIMLYLAYSGLIITVMLAAPLIGIFWIAFTQFNEPKREHYIAKFILFLVASIIVSIASASDTTSAMTTSGIAKTLYDYSNSIFSWAALVVYILLLWYLYKSISPGESKVEETLAKGPGKGVSWLSRKVSPTMRRIAGLSFGKIDFNKLKLLAKEAETVFSISGSTDDEKREAAARVRTALEKGESIEKRIEHYTEYMFNIVDKITDDQVKSELKSAIGKMVAADEKLKTDFEEAKSEIMTSKPNWRTVKTKLKDADASQKSSEAVFLKLRAQLRGRKLL
jgi:hypothetical protein